MRAVSARVSITSQLMRGAADNVILNLLRQLDKEGAVARDADHQTGEILRSLLGFAQRFGVHHVELNMLQFQFGKGVEEIRQLVEAAFTFQRRRGEFNVQQRAVGEQVVIQLADRFQHRRWPLCVLADHRR